MASASRSSAAKRSLPGPLTMTSRPGPPLRTSSPGVPPEPVVPLAPGASGADQVVVARPAVDAERPAVQRNHAVVTVAGAHEHGEPATHDRVHALGRAAGR